MDARYENEGYVSVTTKWYVLDAPNQCTMLIGWDGERGYLLTPTVWPADHDYTENEQHTVFSVEQSASQPSSRDVSSSTSTLHRSLLNRSSR